MLRRFLRLYPASLLAVLVVAVVPAFADAVAIESVYERIDRAAASFKGITGDLTRTTFTAVISDTGIESGSFKMKRSGSGDVQLWIEFKKPAIRYISFQGRKAQIFNPKIKVVQEYDLGKQKDLVEQFLLLGFGSSSKELRSRYTIRLTGEETVEGKTTAKLELIPKSAAISEHVKKVELWIDMDSGNPLRQKFYQGGGDYILVQYANLKDAPDLSSSGLKLDLPPGVKFEYPQK